MKIESGVTQRNGVIDFIRGFSILSVILMHCKIHLPIDQSYLSITWVKWLLSSGYYGVMIFFVVSGFLITLTCINKWGKLQSINISQFYLMRFSRIFPCLVALLAVLSLLYLMGVKEFVFENASLTQAVFSALTFQINWLEAKSGYLPANWDVLWSLSVEEIFYLLFPLLCVVLRKQKYLILVIIVFVLLGPLARTKFTDNDIWSDHSYLACMDGIAIGCLAAIISTKLRSNKLSNLLMILGCVFFGFIFFFRKQAFDIGLTSLGLNVTMLEAGIAFILISTRNVDFKWFASMRWFGRNSYELYLTHSFVVLFAANILYHTGQALWIIALEYMLVVLCSGILAQIVARYFSEPMNQYIREESKTHHPMIKSFFHIS